MVFSSLLFLFLYLGVVLLIYYILPRRLRNLWLLITSIFFYGYGEPIFVLLLLASITVNYLCGLLIEKFTNRPAYKRWTLILCVTINLLLLGYFKYTGLILSSLQALPVFSFLPIPEIALPIGISFYTFQAMSYVIDVYWGNCPAQKNYITFGTYVALFPQLIAGPIVRYIDVETQLQHRRESPDQFHRGVKMFLVGLGKKVLIANAMGSLWGLLKADGANAGLLGAWVGIFAFTLQIYFDFSGYSDMAIGVGRMLDISLPKNFNLPYLAHNVTELWKRWHISLSSWLQEYLYISLGGNRKGKARGYFNLIATMVIGGLWHGASWTFVVWGALHGAALVIHKLWVQWTGSNEKQHSLLGNLFSILLTFVFTSFCWIFFRADTMEKAIAILSGMFSFGDGIVHLYFWLFVAVAAILVCSLAAVFATKNRTLPEKRKNQSFVQGYYPVLNLNKFWHLVLFFIACGLMICLAYTGGSPFIYGTF